jgi:hypothetical protein
MHPLTSPAASQPTPILLTSIPLWHHLSPTHQHQLAHLIATLIQRIRRGEAGKERTHDR